MIHGLDCINLLNRNIMELLCGLYLSIGKFEISGDIIVNRFYELELVFNFQT